MHSQRPRETPLRPWVIAHKDGTVLAAHCNCMAGLGEACTHVAALLFAVEANVQIREMKTVTQEKAYWMLMLPSSLKKLNHSPIANINFTSAKTKVSQLAENSVDTSSVICNKTKPQNHLVPPTQSEADDFFQNLHATGARSVILSLTSPYSDEFVPLSMQSVLPEPLTCLYDESCTNLEYKDLLEK